MNNSELPVIAIVGRPNVGKSTLFNVLTRSRDALVADQPGLTRDRKFGLGKVGPCPYMLVDTGGLNDESSGEMESLITQQALLAVQEADAVLLLVDGREGATALDETIAQRLRGFNLPLYLVVNKSEGLGRVEVCNDFYRLGMGECHPISSAHKTGIYSLMEAVLEPFAAQVNAALEETALADDGEGRIKVAVIGRPNVGKSTLINRMLGEERQLTFDAPGTTRDSVAIPFERDGQAYTLIDTAGVRRRAKVYETIEKFSVIKSMQAIEQAHVVVMLMDAREGMTDQDSSLLGFALECGRALVLAVNKWDGLSHDQREAVRHTLGRKLHFIDFAKPRFISALHGSGVGLLFDEIQAVWQASTRSVNTSQLNRVLEKAVESHPPPIVRGHRIKLRFAHQGGTNPPLFIIHGNQDDAVPHAYQRYLSNVLRQAFQLDGTPIKLVFKKGENPFKDRRNVLTPSQIEKRRRMIRHVKKS